MVGARSRTGPAETRCDAAGAAGRSAVGNQIIEYTEGMKIGHGYNRLTGDVLGSPAVQGATSGVQGAGGQQVSLDCVTIQDVSSLHKSLGISVDAGGSYMGVSASAKVDYVHSCDFSSFSTYVLVRVSVRDAFESVDSPAFCPEAIDLIKNDNPERFRARFGDSYIAGIRKGGEYFAIYQLTGSDETEKESLGVSVHAAFNGLVASGELNVSIKSATSSSKSHLEVQVHVFRQGSIGTADLNVEDIMATARQFPVAVAGDKAFPYAVQLQDYAGLQSPNDAFNYYDIKNQQDVLEDLAKKRFEFLALRDDLKYILKHSEDFENADGTPVDREALSAQYDQTVDAINTMQTEAAACSRDAGHCTFTTFDTVKTRLPRLAKAPDDALAARGRVLADQDPLASLIRSQQTGAAAQLGFDTGMGVAEGQTLPGPGKQRIHDSLPPDQQRGFALAVQFTVDRNRNLDLATRGAAVAAKDPQVAAARVRDPDPFFTLGFDIAAGHFADAVAGGEGSTMEGPGSAAVRDALSPAGQQGFRAAVDLFVTQLHHSRG